LQVDRLKFQIRQFANLQIVIGYAKNDNTTIHTDTFWSEH
jgi:hypothetical protein